MSFFTSRWDLLQKLQRRTSPVPVFFVMPELTCLFSDSGRHLNAGPHPRTTCGPGTFPGSRIRTLSHYPIPREDTFSAALHGVIVPGVRRGVDAMQGRAFVSWIFR